MQLWTSRPHIALGAPTTASAAATDVASLAARARYDDGAKRVVDLVGAVVAIVLLGPVLLVIAVAIRLTGRGPVLFRQERVGRDGVRFTCLKFRTMRPDADDAVHRALVAAQLRGEMREGEGGSFKLDHDPRVTPVGHVLRRTSLDELPQLLNVVRGEMSLVGPRPAMPWEVELFSPDHRRRDEVRPGITGLWQVSGRSRLSFLEALDLDVAYVDRRSLVLDLQILARTVGVVVRGDGAR